MKKANSFYRNVTLRQSCSIILVLLFLFGMMSAFMPTVFAEGEETRDDIVTCEHKGKECVDGEVIVQFTKSQTPTRMQSTADMLHSEVQGTTLSDGLTVLEVPEGETIEDFIKTLEGQPNIEYAQPNYIYKLKKTVNDPGAQLPNPEQWHLKTIDAYKAWDITMGSSDIRVAVLDTGIELDHPEFEGQIYCQTDVVDNDGNAHDDDGHGTHVAGLIAAKANDGLDAVGVAPKTKLIIVDVFTKYFNDEEQEWAWGADTVDVIEGIQYAVGNGARIINMSLGNYEEDIAFTNAIRTAADAGVVCVAAAGNECTDTSHYPSDNGYCISVIATDKFDNRANFSNYGPQKHISAPGHEIYSTSGDIAYDFMGRPYDNDDGYVEMSGTSMASPIVAGVAALVLSVKPELSVEELKSILCISAADLGDPAFDEEFGFGRVNAYYAVRLAVTGSVFADGDGSAEDPYQVSTPDQLDRVRFFQTGNFVLTNDIDMTAATREGGECYYDGFGWWRINSLSGTFDGAGHTINGIHIDADADDIVTYNSGLFKSISESGVVKNLSLANCVFAGEDKVAGVACYNQGTIENCQVQGAVTAKLDNVGGIALENSGTISNCSVTGNVSAEHGKAGGIAGINSGSITHCTMDGTVSAKYDYVGGIAGYSTGLIADCSMNGSVISELEGCGGIVGEMAGSSPKVSNCTNYAEISGYIVGGIAGYGDGYVQFCRNLNTVTGTYTSGGIAGISNGCTISECYNSGTVILTEENIDTETCGGIVGGTNGLYSHIRDCFNIGKVVAKKNWGGILGQQYLSDSVSKCYDIQNKKIVGVWPNDTYCYYLDEDESNTDHRAKTSEKLCGQATFETYDFDDVWTIVEGQRFPILQNVPFEYVNGIDLQETLTIVQGYTYTLSALLTPKDAVNKNMTWSSSDKNVVLVEDGVVTPKELGTANITVTAQDGGFQDTCKVTVVKANNVTGISLNQSALSCCVGDSETLTASISPANATNKNITWQSSNSSVATVVDGVIRAVGAGTATITVTSEDGGMKATCIITVSLSDIQSSVYTVDQSNSLLRDVPLNTTTALLKANLANIDANIHIYSGNNEVYDGCIITTGMKVKLIVNSKEKDVLNIVVRGDSNGDGKVSITDYTLIRLDILELKNLAGVFLTASDVNGDGKISITDYTLIRLHILGLKSI